MSESNSNYQLKQEYNALKDALHLETNIKENKKLFKKLAREYFNLAFKEY